MHDRVPLGAPPSSHRKQFVSGETQLIPAVIGLADAVAYRITHSNHSNLPQRLREPDDGMNRAERVQSMHGG